MDVRGLTRITITSEVGERSGLRLRAAAWGLGAAVALLGLYTGIVWGASRSADHVLELLASDWLFVLALAAGFGTQAGLYVHLRHLRRASGAAAGATGLGTGTSMVAMVACCAHHAADIVPLLSFSVAVSVAGFLAEWRVPLMGLGVALNLVGIGISIWLLRKARHSLSRQPVTLACYPDGGSQ